jgi:hypothetical protein
LFDPDAEKNEIAAVFWKSWNFFPEFIFETRSLLKSLHVPEKLTEKILNDIFSVLSIHHPNPGLPSYTRDHDPV